MSDEICRSTIRCRLCGGSDLTSVIDLGQQYLAGIFVRDEVERRLDRTYPLEVVRCSSDGGCGLVQLRDSIDPAVMYDDYGYRSGTNEMMRANLESIVAEAEQLVALRAGDAVLDIGCNDGTLLDAYRTAGIDRLGVDPSAAAAEAEKKGYDVVRGFFSEAVVAERRPGRRFRVITSIAMFYDLEDPLQFASEVASLLAEDGVWIIELSYLPFMLERGSFDTICHEHLEYYSLAPVEWLLGQLGLAVERVAFNDVNGGSFRLFIRRADAVAPSAEGEVLLEQVRADERDLLLHTDAPYARFREASMRVRDDLRALLDEVTAGGARVYAYGASTKGNTILQFCGIDASLVAKAADRNPDKWGRHTLGTGIPIVSEAQAREECPEYFLVLPWHFLDGFLIREHDYLAGGGRFIVPIPEVRVIDAAGAV